MRNGNALPVPPGNWPEASRRAASTGSTSRASGITGSLANSTHTLGAVRRTWRVAPPNQYGSSMMRPAFDASRQAGAPLSSGQVSSGWSTWQASRLVTTFSSFERSSSLPISRSLSAHLAFR